MEGNGFQGGVELWFLQVNQLLMSTYCLDSDMAGWDVEDVSAYHVMGFTPTQFINWYAEKYDLVKWEEFQLSHS